MRIEDLSVEELLELNQIICDRIDELRALQDSEAMRQLQIGNTVSFESKEGRIFGIVIKINRKTVSVLSQDKRQWKVPPGLLTRLKEVSHHE
jgi:hypothetical protein